MDEFLILLQAKLDEAKSKGNVNADIDKIQGQIDKLKLQVEVDPKTLSNLTKQLEGIINQKITISNIGINSSNAIKSAQQTGQQIGNAINQGITNAVPKGNKTLKSFSELKIGTGNIGAIIDKKGIVDTEQSLNKIKQLYSEFGQVKITDKIFDSDGNIQKFKVNIEQVNGELKETRSFVMELNGSSFAFPNDIIKGSESIIQHLDKTKNVVNQTGEAINELANKAKIDKIQLSMDNGYGASEYQNHINSIIASLEKYGIETKEAQTITASLQSTLDSMKGLSGQELVTQADKLEQEFKAVKASVEEAKLSYDKFMQPVSNEKATSLINRINTFLTKNTNITNDAKAALQGYVDELSRGVNLNRWNEINGKLKQTENSMRGLGKLGASLRNQLSQAVSSFSMWLSASTLVMKFISETRKAVIELKNVNTYLTEISKTNHQLSQSDLEQIGNNAFGVASKYGKTATDYLSGVQDMSRAGYQNAEAMAELSTAAQGAGDMTAEVANKMVISTDKAYKLGGSVEELTKILDGVNWICDNNAVNMSELSEGMSIVGSTAASLGVDVNELTATLGTMAATTQQSGSEVARAFKAILLNIRQVSDEEEGIDAEGLTKYEKACNALGVSLKETKDGVLQTRDAMEVLKELSEEYNKLGENDIRRTDLLNSVGGKLRSTQLDALLRQWDTYENMLKQFSEGSGTMAVEAEKTANSWEGSMNRLSNTWTDTIGNIANSDAIIIAINGLNSFLNIINKLTGALGSLGTISLIGGGFFGAKGHGLTNYVTIS